MRFAGEALKVTENPVLAFNSLYEIPSGTCDAAVAMPPSFNSLYEIQTWD